MLAGTFKSMGQLPLVGWLLAVLLIVGLAFAGRALRRGEWRRGAQVPAAFLAAVAAFALTTAVSRALAGVSFATSSRYLYVVAALLVPPLAVAFDAIARKRRALGPLLVVLLLVGIPGNLSKTTSSFQSTAQTARYRKMMLSFARLPLATRVPRSLRPEPNVARDVTIGWLLDGVRSGRLPRPKPASPSEVATYTLRVGLEVLDRGDGRNCRALSGPWDRTLQIGQSVVVDGTVAVQLRQHGASWSNFVLFGASFLSKRAYHTLRVVGQPMSVRIRAVSPGAGIC
jgi:hypothetical protein